MNYQGYLTDSSGNPLNGTYNLAFELWDAPSWGNSEWGPEIRPNTQVTHGIFQVTLGSSITLDPDVFDEALFLAVRVNGTWVVPRQPLRAVPYAFGLVPGAQVEGDPAGSSYALSVRNTDGAQGLYVDAEGDSLYGIYNADVTFSQDGYAGPDTYLFVPTLNAIGKYTNAPLSPQDGYMRVVGSAGAAATVIIPIQIERPYGREYLLKNARVYYLVNEASIESAEIMGVDFSNGGQTTIGSDSSSHDSTSFTFFDIDATSDYTVTHNMAPTGVVISVDLSNPAAYVDLYGVRLRLDSSY
jgi:hypothetical protein